MANSFLEEGLIELRINNRICNYKKPLTIFQACLDKKVYLPRFCYHVSLKIAGNCRMCLIEEKSSIKPVVSCAITIMSGMDLYTNTELVKKAREGVIEYLLINHPLDCPICDQGGECDLQDQTMVFGADRGRFYGNKRAVKNKNFGFLIKTYLNRCIHCARCTRFMNELAGVDFALLGRGVSTEISLYEENYLISEVSGNIIDLCPVGALTSKPYAFKARPWELVSVYTFDIVEPFGSNIDINYRSLEVLRILPRLNSELNGEWISDRTRFCYDSFKIQRLSNIFFKNKNFMLTLSWYNVFCLMKNLFFQIEIYLGVFKKFYTVAFSKFNTGEYTDLETTSFLKNIYQGLSFNIFGHEFSDFRNFFLGNEFFVESNNNEIKNYLIFIHNVNPRLESPVLNLKIKSLLNEEENKINIWVMGFLGNFNYDYNHLGLVIDKDKIFFEKLLTYKNSNVIYILKNTIKNFSLNKRFYSISDSVSTVSFQENSFILSNLWGWSLLNLYFGSNTQYEILNIARGNFLLNYLHHVDNNYWVLNYFKTGIMLPVKFYLEKVSSYFSENGYYFSTLTNIYGYFIRGTTEEWKILKSLCELLQIRVKFDDIMFEFRNRNSGRLNFFKLNEVIFNAYKKKELTLACESSRINNYYQTGLLSRLSPVLNLCSKVGTIYNDYRINLNI